MVAKYAISRKNKHYCKYVNVPAAFELQACNYTDENGDKFGIPYLFAIKIEDKMQCFDYAYDFNRLDKMLDFYREYYGLNDKCRIVLYCKDLGEVFQYLRTHYNFTEIFAREERSVYKCCIPGFEFRDASILCGGSMEEMADITGIKYVEYDCNKVVMPGCCDRYDIDVAHNTVNIITRYISGEIDHYGLITNIPLTNTGRVREYCRDYCFNNNKFYKKLMEVLTLTGVKEYKLLSRAFQGGYVNANKEYKNHLLANVKSWDFSSSYIAAMCSEKYPMSRGEFVKTTAEEILNDKDNCYVFNIEITGLEAMEDFAYYIAYDKCIEIEDYETYAGKVSRAGRVLMSITNVDLEIILATYCYETIKIGDCVKYKAMYLPKVFIECILNLYKEKTILKGDKEHERRYTIIKQMANASFGMCIQAIINDVIAYVDGHWDTTKANESEQIRSYNNSKKRFLFYPWGVFITAYARRNLFEGILECGDDYIYSDTDSLKVVNPEYHEDFINDYNKRIRAKLTEVCKCYNIDIEALEPKTYDGKAKPLGYWENDGYYTRFKTLGSKRYLSEEDGEVSCTISGVSKNKTGKYLNGFSNPFEEFNEYLSIPEDYTGRRNIIYVDNEITINSYGREYKIGSGVYKEPSAYNMLMTPIMALYNEVEEVDVL